MIKLATQPKPLHSHKAFDRILKKTARNNSIIIDLGCEIPLFLFELEMKYKFRKFIGVDILENEIEIIKRHAETYNLPEVAETCHTIKDCHEYFISYNGEKSYNLEDQTIYDLIDSYDKTYNIITNFDVVSQNLDILGKGDIVFLKDVLHFIKFNESLLFIPKLIELVRNEGFIVIQANHTEHESMTNPAHTKK